MFASLAAVVLLAFIVNENLSPGTMAQNLLMKVLLVLVAVCLLLAFFRRTVMRVRLLNTLPYMLVAATPFVWYKLTENHSCIHSFFTHRDLAVTIFATACILVDLSRKESTL